MPRKPEKVVLPDIPPNSDGVTLFFYNIGKDTDESQMKQVLLNQGEFYRKVFERMWFFKCSVHKLLSCIAVVIWVPVVFFAIVPSNIIDLKENNFFTAEFVIFTEKLLSNGVLSI